MLKEYQREFIKLALDKQALLFGDYTLKSGRVSPYFFNMGLFNTGQSLATLGSCYAKAIVEKCPEFDVIFGPAYKGISLATTAAVALSSQFNRDVPYCFNRKEVKAHGEGGKLIGAPLRGRVLIVDDVITAGTAIREALAIIADEGAEAVGVVVGLDRKERGPKKLSAIQEIVATTGVTITSIVDINDILTYIREQEMDDNTLERIEKYLAEFGV
jgi:orotate phosphoribosyltransferase